MKRCKKDKYYKPEFLVTLFILVEHLHDQRKLMHYPSKKTVFDKTFIVNYYKIYISTVLRCGTVNVIIILITHLVLFREENPNPKHKWT